MPCGEIVDFVFKPVISVRVGYGVICMAISYSSCFNRASGWDANDYSLLLVLLLLRDLASDLIYTDPALIKGRTRIRAVTKEDLS